MELRFVIRLYLWVSLAIFLTDILTKWLVVSSMILHDSIEVIPNFFDLTYVQNRGVAFGMLRNVNWGWKLPVLSGVAMLAVALIFYYGSKVPPQNKLLHLALALVLGGIFGNLSDRLVNGYVIDFLDFHLFNFHWPTFNVADSAITVGVILLMLDTLRTPPDLEIKEAPKQL